MNQIKYLIEWIHTVVVYIKIGFVSKNINYSNYSEFSLKIYNYMFTNFF
jgi:hypothetical protein